MAHPKLYHCRQQCNHIISHKILAWYSLKKIQRRNKQILSDRDNIPSPRSKIVIFPPSFIALLSWVMGGAVCPALLGGEWWQIDDNAMTAWKNNDSASGTSDLWHQWLWLMRRNEINVPSSSELFFGRQKITTGTPNQLQRRKSYHFNWELH